jgi:preprotein translocase subunit YajC
LPIVDGAASLLPLVLLGVVFYFLILRPSRNRQRQQAQVVASARPGAQIRTVGGIFGQVVDRDDDIVRIEIAPGVTISIVSTAIAAIIVPAPEPLAGEE